MPCRVDYPETGYYADHIRSAKDSHINKLSVEIDELRELILELRDIIHGTDAMKHFLDKELGPKVAKVDKNQRQHRQDDLDRLLHCGKLNKEQMTKVLNADPHKPLEPQLGFNPDKY